MGAPASIDVTPVHTRADLKQFIRFPLSLYPPSCPWVAPLFAEVKKTLDSERNPFYRHSSAQLFLARRDGVVAGRIAAIHNTRHLDIHKDGAGFFGFFECVDDQNVADALFAAAAAWVKEKGCTILRGPASHSLNEECGLLVDNFDDMPFVMNPYNHAYYVTLVETYGFTKAMDLLCYFLNADPLPERLQRIGRLVQKRHPNITIRPMRFDRFDEEVEVLKDLYNKAWEKNWGFVPVTDEEFYHTAQDLKRVADPRLLFIGEVDREPVGFSVTLPDINWVIKPARGRLFPVGLMRILWRGYVRNNPRTRTLVMGVIPGYRKLGVDALFYYHTFLNGRAMGVKYGEQSWILENNSDMNRALQKMGAHVYRTYRMYDKPL